MNNINDYTIIINSIIEKRTKIVMKLAERLNECRVAMNKFQNQVAIEVGISKSSISRYEKIDSFSYSSPEKLVILSNYYNKSTDYLVGLTNNPLPINISMFQLPKLTKKPDYFFLVETLNMILKYDYKSIKQNNIINSYKTGDRIKYARNVKNISQKELSEIFPKHSTAIYLYEKDQRIPPIDVLYIIAESLEVSLDFLLCKTDIPFPIHDGKKAPYIIEKPRLMTEEQTSLFENIVINKSDYEIINK